MVRCLLNILPVELLHVLFSYFLAHEILLSFTSVSPYLDAILLSYTNYRVDLRSILKTHFDLVCRTIKPDQVVSLTLSGRDDTPKQCELFFTYFRIEHFSTLRSLRLVHIDKQLMERMINLINEVNRNCHISLDYCDIRSLVSSPVFRQLTRLRNDSKQFIWNKWTDLLPFSFERSSIGTFRYICQNAPKLQSLDICLENNSSNIASAFQLPQLTQLILKVEVYSVTMDQMEQIRAKLPRLKHLELHTACSLDLVDGFRWKSISGSLITLNLSFIVNVELMEDILDSFRTSFWLEEKRWFVAYKNRRFFSIPRFADTSVAMDFYPSIRSTATDKSIFFNHITELKASESSTNTFRYFPKVRTLNLNDSVQYERLFKIVPISKVAHVILSWPMSNIASTVLKLTRMPCLHTLTITDNLPNFLQHAQKLRFQQIRTLIVDWNSTMDEKHYVTKLCHIFPFVERLRVTSAHSSMFARVIDGFKHLSNVSFMYYSITQIQYNDWSMKPEWAIYGARRLTIGKFKCQLSDTYIHAWIDEQPPQSSWFFHWWERRDYLQSRLQQNLQLLEGKSGYIICRRIYYMIYYYIYYMIFFGYLKFITINLADMSVNIRCVYTCVLLPLLTFTFVSPPEVRWHVKVIVFSAILIILDIMIFATTGNWNALTHHQVGMLFCDYRQSLIGKTFTITPALDIHRLTYNYLNNTFICTGRYNMIIWCLGIITLPLLSLYASFGTIQSISSGLFYSH